MLSVLRRGFICLYSDYFARILFLCSIFKKITVNYKTLMSEEKPVSLTEAQKARIERNRAKALSLKQAKLVSHPYAINKK